MEIPDSAPFDPEKAIWDKDFEALQKALQAGWSLPYARVKDGGAVQDTTLVIRVISLRWTAGWKLLATAFPFLYENHILWQLAIREAVPGIIEDFIEHGFSATGRLENGQEPLHLLAESMGRALGEPIPDEDLIESVHVLEGASASLLTPYPGSFVAGDVSPRGHTLWTRSAFFRRWDLVSTFMPTHWKGFLGMPRALESLDSLRSLAMGGDRGATRCWKAWTERFLEPWLAMQKAEPFSSLIDAALVPSLSPLNRQVVWERWSMVDEAGWTSLHDLGLLGNEAVVRQALACAITDRAPCLARWEAMSEDGLRPCDLWEMANGRTAPPPSLDIQSVPEIRDALRPA